jgi:hypothetical protein
MEMKRVMNFKELVKQFPLIKMVPQAMDILKDAENLESEIWILIKKGEIYIGRKGGSNGNEKLQKRG